MLAADSRLRSRVNNARPSIGCFIRALNLNERHAAKIATVASALAESIVAARYTIERYTVGSLS
jgi:hypothetical protein